MIHHVHWHTRVGWKVHRLTMMSWSNITRCGLYFNIVSVHTHLPSVLQRLDSGGIEALILILEKNSSTADMTSSSNRYCFPARCCSCWGTENSQMVPNQENMEGDQPIQSHQSRTAAIATTDLCARASSWWNRTPFVSFPGRFEMSLVLLFKVLSKAELLIQCGLNLEGNIAVNIRKDWILCMPSFNAVAQLLSQHMNFSANSHRSDNEPA